MNSKSNRVVYGFKLDFPQRFTMKQLQNGRNVQYITLRKRVEKALLAGELVVVGKQIRSHQKKTKGRHQLIYERVNAKTTAVATEQVTA